MNDWIYLKARKTVSWEENLSKPLSDPSPVSDINAPCFICGRFSSSRINQRSEISTANQGESRNVNLDLEEVSWWHKGGNRNWNHAKANKAYQRSFFVCLLQSFFVASYRQNQRRQGKSMQRRASIKKVKFIVNNFTWFNFTDKGREN